MESIDNFCCETSKAAKENIPDEITISEISDFFKIFGDYTRVKLLFAMKEHEICVNDLSIILSMQQPAVSHQLKTLKKYNLVSVRKEGKLSYYSLNDEHIFDILDIGLKHIAHLGKSEEKED